MTSGTLEQFVDDMNKKVQELGISQTTHFSNPVGIFDENNYSTACDMAVILHAAMENEICKRCCQQEIIQLHVHNSIRRE